MPEPRFPIVLVDELGQRHGPFAVSVVDELARMNVTWVDESGQHRILSANKDIVALNPHIAVCDICSNSPVAWDVDVAPFTNFEPLAGPFSLFRSVDGFYLCEPCGQYVLAGDRQSLLRHQLRAFMRRWSGPLALGERILFRALLEDQARTMHEQFWQNMRGIKRIDEGAARDSHAD